MPFLLVIIVGTLIVLFALYRYFLTAFLNKKAVVENKNIEILETQENQKSFNEVYNKTETKKLGEDNSDVQKAADTVKVNTEVRKENKVPPEGYFKPDFEKDVYLHDLKNAFDIPVEQYKTQIKELANVVEQQITNSELNVMRDSLAEFSIRIEDIENALLILNEKIDYAIGKSITVPVEYVNNVSSPQSSTVKELSSDTAMVDMISSDNQEKPKRKRREKPAASEKTTATLEVKEKKKTERTRQKNTETKAPSDNSDNNINEIIYKYYDEGKTVEEIASLLKLGKGEVLLRIGLRK